MMSIHLNSIAILNIHSVDYHCINNGICESEAIDLFLKMLILIKKGTIIKMNFLIIYRKRKKKS